MKSKHRPPFRLQLLHSHLINAEYQMHNESHVKFLICEGKINWFHLFPIARIGDMLHVSPTLFRSSNVISMLVVILNP